MRHAFGNILNANALRLQIILSLQGLLAMCQHFFDEDTIAEDAFIAFEVATAFS